MKTKILAVSLLLLFCISSASVVSAARNEPASISVSCDDEVTVPLSQQTFSFDTDVCYPNGGPGFYTKVDGAPIEYSLYKNGIFIIKGIYNRGVSWNTLYLELVPGELGIGDYNLKLRYHGGQDCGHFLLPSERWLLIHIVP